MKEKNKVMGKGAFPINLFPHRAWWGFAVQLRVGDWVVWGGWERLGLTLCRRIAPVYVKSQCGI